MRGFTALMGIALLGAAMGMGEARNKILRQDKDKRATRESSELSAPAGSDLSAMEAEAMREFADTRVFANLGCQYATETIIILDNSSAIFDKELWMFKLYIKEIAAAFLRVNAGSRFGLILTTQPVMPLIAPVPGNNQNIASIWQTVKGIQRVDNGMVGNVATATQTAISLFNLNVPTLMTTHNLILMVAPYTALVAQLGQAAVDLEGLSMIRRFVIATRMTQPVYQMALEAYVACPACNHIQYVGNCTPASYLFLLKRMYPTLCVPPSYYREAAIVTFQVDGLPADDENMPDFVEKFLTLLSETTGVDREYLEVLDIRDSSSTTGPQYNARRLKSIDTLVDLPQDTLLDVVVRDSPVGLKDTPFRIAGRLDTDLRNELSPVATLFSNELSGIPKIRKISQPRESIFSRPNGGLTFHKLYLGDGFSANLGDSPGLAELLQN